MLAKCPPFHYPLSKLDTEYDQAKVPPYNGDDPPPAPGSLKVLLLPPLLNKVQNKGTQGVRARYDAELPPIISIVWYPGRPVISVPFQTYPRLLIRYYGIILAFLPRRCEALCWMTVEPLSLTKGTTWCMLCVCHTSVQGRANHEVHIVN